MTRPSPLRCRAVVLLLLSILSASSPVFVVVGLGAPSMTRGVFDRRPFRLLPPGSASTACLSCDDRPLRARAACACCSKERNGDDGGGDQRETEESMASTTSAPVRRRQASLFIFGLGNVGGAVAELASRVRYLGDGDEGGGELGGILLGLGAAYHDDRTEDEEEEAGSRGEEGAVFGSIVATVRTATAVTEGNRRIECVQFDDRGAVIDRLSRATHVLITVPPRMMIHDDDRRRTDDGPAGTGSSSRLYEDPVHAAGYHRYIPRDCTWVGYVSTTGVYGDHGGCWVDESSETRTKPGARASGYLDVEKDWMESFGLGHGWGRRLSVFRCAGVYGPHSSALHTVWRKQRKGPATIAPADGDDSSRGGRGGEGRSDFGTPVGSVNSPRGDDGGASSKRRRESYTSRVHIDDVARAIVSDMLLPAPPVVVRDRHPSSDDREEEESSSGSNPGAAATTAIATSRPSVNIYNLADDEPAPRSVVMAQATELLEEAKKGLGFDDDILDGWLLRAGAGRRRDGGGGRGGTATIERGRRRSTDDKRVANGRMREDVLSPHGGLSYPTYREGLVSILTDLGRRPETDVPRKGS